MDKVNPAIRKRQQISRANQLMFVWIAGVSVVVGFSLVLALFLSQKIIFGEKVLSEKGKTVAALENNLKAAPELKNNIRALNTDTNLRKTRLNTDDSALQSVLDALPADANSTAMAASLQKKLLTGVPDVILESLRVDAVNESASGDVEIESDTASEPGAIGFTFVVSAPAKNGEGQENLRKILLQLESSIRPFTVNTLSIESQGARVTLTASGVGYYEPAKTLTLRNKVVRP